MTADEKTATESNGGQQPAVSAPVISLPKGGGAIRGMGEKFAANPVTGTGSMSVPIATSPGRSGFGPQLSLSYDSGAGNGPFGFGWNLSLPAITRKTDKGLPRYEDLNESDVFILSGSEDLVPVFRQDPDGSWVKDHAELKYQRDSDGWVRDSSGRLVIQDDPRTINGDTYTVRRYRPRIEGLFARIERWTNIHDATDVSWRSISKDNITTWYGKTTESRIADPSDLSRIFSWLICESYDDKGNVIAYEYKQEDSAGVNLAQAHEANRSAPLGLPDLRSANSYLKRIRYGNHAPYLPQLAADQPWPVLPADDKWHFEVVFDYGEGHYRALSQPTDDPQLASASAVPSSTWPVRLDPFSTYRAGFEVRTYRLCQRVLMFHHIPDLPSGEKGYDGLVRSTDFDYSYEENPQDARNPIYSFLLSVTQSGYKLQPAGDYLKKSLPPVEVTYSEPVVQDEVHEVDPASLENLPIGLDGSAYQWTDLHGEGIPGILTEQAGAWFYKRNLSPVNLVRQNGSSRIEACFAPVELVATKPNLTLAGGQAEFMDLAGDGQPDVVVMEGPMPGLYEHDEEESWQPFRPFTSRLKRDMRDPNLKFVDLDGDGHADVLITEDDAFVWHPSLAEEGFGPSLRVTQSLDEEKGPRLIFADGTQSIYLADLSGDGLTDLARIRNGEVCYWPNLGYGRFGAKVTMDNSPWFDNPDQFDQKRIRLADIDGSGTTDIIYLHRDGVRLYFNQSGNSWSQPRLLNVFPRVDDLVSIVPTDLLGNGTACLVWSSPLPSDMPRPMRYVDLMGGQKPHLLVKTNNNLGAKTVIDYAPSTKFYLQDKRAGKPWITRLPFPVHCVEKVTVTDDWRQTSFSTMYSYHHGYFDGPEREFRGFGRVEQVDVESFGKFAQGNTASPYITDDKTLYQPPIKTVTWFHTGAMLDEERILSQFAHEYFPRWFEDMRPDEVNVLGGFEENALPEPDVEALDPQGNRGELNVEEWREALRACKGMMLRQEVYELDIDALERGEQRPVRLFTTAYHNCLIRRLQPQVASDVPVSADGWERQRFDSTHHAVFLVAESEAITYHYELDLTAATVKPDPRIAHTLNLKFDDYANLLQSVAVVYPRLGLFEDDPDPHLADGLADALDLIHRVQAPPSAIDPAKKEPHLAYTETRYTNDVDEDDTHRLRVPCEVLTYELTGIIPAYPSGYFSLADLGGLRLSPDEYQTLTLVPPQLGITDVAEILYHQIPDRTSPQKRLVEDARMLFFGDNLTDPRPFRELGPLGLLYETYKLALTDDLLSVIFASKLDAHARAKLNDASISGYLSGATLAARFSGMDTSGQYWIRSGIAGFADDAAQHFFLPEDYTDPFGNVTMLQYDPLDLYVASSIDALLNVTRVTRFDFRVLAPCEMQDINNNLSEIFFDVFGLPTAMAVKGKGDEGDNLLGFDDDLANPSLDDLNAFFDSPAYDEVAARRWLGNATIRHIYYFGETRHTDGSIAWGTCPPCACGIVRETHVSQLAPGEQSQVQAGFEYSDGMGTVLVKKVQAEPEAPGQPLRWIANGRTILNNKGKPVKKYEPYFSSSGHQFEEPQEEGVTPIIYYDAAGRTVRTESPDGSFSRVEFSPWHVLSFDQNDTVRESKWFADRNSPDPEQPLPVDPISGKPLVTYDQRAAWLAAQHERTPALAILDSLGRDVIAVAHNRKPDANRDWQDERYLTFSKLDAEGKRLWIRDARKNLVIQYITPPAPNDHADDQIAGFAPCYDMAGNLLFQHSMDAGDRWILNDSAREPMLSWNSRGYAFRTEYDPLHRPLRSFVQGGDANDPNSEFFVSEVLFERTVYGEQHPEDVLRNLRGRVFTHLDQAGMVASEIHDFKGNLVRGSRRLAQVYDRAVNWKTAESVIPVNGIAKLDLAKLNNALMSLLEDETFASATVFDALNRPIQIVAPHSDRLGTKLNVIQHGYNEANLLERVDVWLEEAIEPLGLLDVDTATQHIVENLDYNAKGQRTRIDYGNGVRTTFEYDPFTFRLTRLVTDRGSSFASDWPKPPDPPRGGIQNLNYFYDPVGNITDIRDDAQQTVFFDGQKVEPSNSYVYDAIYRLISATGREHIGQNASPQKDDDDSPCMNQPLPTDSAAMRNYTERYDYDSVGNILKMIHQAGVSGSWTRRYDYEPTTNRLRATSLPGDSAGFFSGKYAYDAHGSMTTMPHLSSMRWDFRDQLQATSRQAVNAGSRQTTWYAYDASGQRVRKVMSAQSVVKVKERIYLGGFEVYREYNGSGSPTLERETLHVVDDRQRIALVETRTRGNDLAPPQLIRYQFGNHLSSARLELDDLARVISYEEYSPYGGTSYQSVRSQTETPKRYRYTAKERDEESSFYYHGARYYTPWLGRWVSCDPAWIIDGLNFYQYVRNNPIRSIDATGTQTQVYTQNDFEPLVITRDKAANVEPPATTPAPAEVNIDAPSGTSTNLAATAKDVVNSDFSIGVATGLRESLNPLGFLEPPGKNSSREFQLGRAVGKLLAGGVKIFLGGTAVEVGTGAAGVGGLAAPVTGGASLIISAGGVVLVAAGGVLTIWGAADVLAGLATGIVAMAMPGDKKSGSPSGDKPAQPPRGGRPPNLSPPGANRQGAFNEAKRRNGIPTSQEPTRTLPNTDKRGNPQPGRTYEYEVPKEGGGTRTVRIRDDAGGHDFPDDPSQDRGPHFNDEDGNHYDYPADPPPEPSTEAPTKGQPQ